VGWFPRCAAVVELVKNIVVGVSGLLERVGTRKGGPFPSEEIVAGVMWVTPTARYGALFPACGMAVEILWLPHTVRGMGTSFLAQSLYCGRWHAPESRLVPWMA
jgi:hypothetical protein